MTDHQRIIVKLDQADQGGFVSAQGLASFAVTESIRLP
jgi:hypothetical protein